MATNSSEEAGHVKLSSLLPKTSANAENVAPAGVASEMTTPLKRGLSKGLGINSGSAGLATRMRKSSVGPGGPTSPISRRTPLGRALGSQSSKAKRRALGDITNRKGANPEGRSLRASTDSASGKSEIVFPLNFDAVDSCKPVVSDSQKSSVPGKPAGGVSSLGSAKSSVKLKGKLSTYSIPRDANGNVESPEYIPPPRPPTPCEPPVLDLGPDFSVELARRPPVGGRTPQLFVFRDDVDEVTGMKKEEHTEDKKIVKKPDDPESEAEDVGRSEWSGMRTFAQGFPKDHTIKSDSYDRLFTEEEDVLTVPV